MTSRLSTNFEPDNLSFRIRLLGAGLAANKGSPVAASMPVSGAWPLTTAPGWPGRIRDYLMSGTQNTTHTGACTGARKVGDCLAAHSEKENVEVAA